MSDAPDWTTTINTNVTVDNTVTTTGSSTPTYGQTTVGSTATAIAAPRTNRSGLTIKLASNASAPVYLGTDSSVTPSNGYLLEAGNTITAAEPKQVYGIVVTGSQVVYWEDE